VSIEAGIEMGKGEWQISALDVPLS
jgi:hypothetical protein